MLSPHRRSGQGLVEYSVIIALVSVVVILTLTTLGSSVGTVYSNVICSVRGSGPGCPGPIGPPGGTVVVPPPTTGPGSVGATSTLPGFTLPTIGNVTFNLYTTSDCSGSPVQTVTDTFPSSGPFLASFSGLATGTYYVQAVYLGVLSTCTGPESVTDGGGRFAYVLNQGSNPGFTNASVTQIDTSTNLVTATLPIGPSDTGVAGGFHAVGEAISPDGSKVYVLMEGDDGNGGNDGSSRVLIINASTFTISASVQVATFNGLKDADTSTIAVNPVTGDVYIGAISGCLVSCGSFDNGWGLAVMNPTSHAFKYIGWDDLWGFSSSWITGIAFTADGGTTFVTDGNNQDVTKITNLSGTVPATNTGDPFGTVTPCSAAPAAVCVWTGQDGNVGFSGFNARAITLTPSTGYVTEEFNNGVLPFSLAGFTEACVWPCNVDGTERTLVGGGYVPNSPGSIVVTSGKAFAGDNSATVEVPLVSGAAVSLTAGNPASGLVLDTTTGTIWALDENTACCGLNGTVTRIDAPTDAVLGSPITVGVHPIFVVVG